MDLNLSLRNTDIGLATAWLLSTLGSRNSHKKVVKKDILKSSIPETCQKIQSSEIPLRYSSKLMYGIVLLYRQKVDYFFNEASITKMRLQRDLVYRGLENKSVEVIQTNGHGKDTRVPAGGIAAAHKGVRFDDNALLIEDPLFDVEMDLVQPFEDFEANQSFNKSANLGSELGGSEIVDTARAFNESLSFGGEDIVLDFELEDDLYDIPGDRNGLLELDEDQAEHEQQVYEEELSLIDINLGRPPERDFDTEIAELNNKSSGTFQLSNSRVAASNEEPVVTKRPNLKRVKVDSELSIQVSQYRKLRRLVMELSPDDLQLVLAKPDAAGRRALEPTKLIGAMQGEKLPEYIRSSYRAAYEGTALTQYVPAQTHFANRSTVYLLDDELEVSRRGGERDIETSRRLNLADHLRVNAYDDFGLDDSFGDRGGDTSQRHDTTFDLSFPGVEIMSNWDPEDDELRPNSSDLGTSQIAKFLTFLRSRTLILGELIDGDRSFDDATYKISFTELIPVDSVSRKHAAASFSSMLVLATNGTIRLESESTFGSPVHIIANFSH